MSDEETFLTVSKVGVALFLAALAVSGWRTRVIFQHAAPGAFLRSVKGLFHASLTTTLALQLLHYVSRVAAGYDSEFGYSVHLLGLWTALVAFSLAIYYWSSALSLGRTAARRKQVLVTLNAVALMHTLITIGFLISARNWDDFFARDDAAYVSLVVEHAALLLAFALALTWYGLTLQRKVKRHPQWAPMAWRHRVSVLAKLNSIMLVVTFCFALRTVLLFTLVDEDFALDMPYGEWTLLSDWVPTLVPAGLLLYQLRRPDNPGQQQHPQAARSVAGAGAGAGAGPRRSKSTEIAAYEYSSLAGGPGGGVGGGVGGGEVEPDLSGLDELAQDDYSY